MITRILPVVMVAIGFVVIVAIRASAGAQVNDTPAELEATISAMRTSIAAQSTQVANLEASLPTPTVAPGTPAPGAGSFPISSALVVLYYYFLDDGDSTNIFGELQNVSNAPAIAPPVVFEFLDEDRNSYGTDIVSPVYAWVPAGGRMPFHTLSVMGDSLRLGDWASESVSAGDPSGNLSDLDTSKLKFEEVPSEGSLDEYGGEEGMVRNTGDAPVDDVLVHTAIYDANDRFVGACWTIGGTPTIPPGKAVRFTVASGCGTFSVATESPGTAARGPYMYRLIPTID